MHPRAVSPHLAVTHALELTHTLMAEQGFLGKEIDDWKAECRRRHVQWFQLAEDVNAFGMDALEALSVHNRLINEVLLAALYLRTLHTFQATVLLAERGMLTQGRMLVRSMLDAIFPLVAIAKDENFAKEYAESHKVQQLRFLKNAQNLGPPLLDRRLKDPETKRLFDELNREIKGKRLKEFQTKELAQKAGLENWYLTVYAIHCGTVHSRAGDLEEYLVLNDKNEIKELATGPTDSGLKELVMAAIQTMLMGIEHVDSLCKLELLTCVGKLQVRLDTLVQAELIQQQSDP